MTRRAAVMNPPYFVAANHSKIQNMKIETSTKFFLKKTCEKNCNHFLEFNDTEQITMASFVHVFTMMCSGYMHSTGRVKVPTQKQGQVDWAFPLTCCVKSL